MPAHKIPLEIRFWRNVNKTETCWLWTGYKGADGYGRIYVAPKVCRAPRVSYEMHVGPIPDGLFVCHHCDTPACIRPDHLFLGDCAANMADMWRKGRYKTGDAHWTHIKPECLSKGETHHAKRRPETVVRGEKHGGAKLNEAKVREIRRLYADEGIGLSELGRRYGVTPQLIQHVVRRTAWRHVE